MCLLAPLVKLLRRCLQQMTWKIRQFVDTSAKFEREAKQQVRQHCYLLLYICSFPASRRLPSSMSGKSGSICATPASLLLVAGCLKGASLSKSCLAAAS